MEGCREKDYTRKPLILFFFRAGGRFFHDDHCFRYIDLMEIYTLLKNIQRFKDCLKINFMLKIRKNKVDNIHKNKP